MLRLREVSRIHAADRHVNAFPKNAAAIARPIPRDPPVTIATLPVMEAMRNILVSAAGEIAGASPHGGSAAFHSDIEAMPAAGGHALRRVADQIPLSELVENARNVAFKSFVDSISITRPPVAALSSRGKLERCLPTSTP